MQGLEGCNELIMFKEPKKRPGSGLDQGEEREKVRDGAELCRTHIS